VVLRDWRVAELALAPRPDCLPRDLVEDAVRGTGRPAGADLPRFTAWRRALFNRFAALRPLPPDFETDLGLATLTERLDVVRFAVFLAALPRLIPDLVRGFPEARSAGRVLLAFDERPRPAFVPLVVAEVLRLRPFLAAAARERFGLFVFLMFFGFFIRLCAPVRGRQR
jgi:hypothetical protein